MLISSVDEWRMVMPSLEDAMGHYSGWSMEISLFFDPLCCRGLGFREEVWVNRFQK